MTAIQMGMELLWIIGDDLVQHTAGQALAARNDSFMKNAFETSIHASSATDTPNRNVISRITNNIIRAINTKREIPKWIVIIPEADLLNCVNYTQFGVSAAYGMVLEFIMASTEKALQQFFGTLPQKANKYHWPYILWIEPTLHMSYTDNELRIKFLKSLHTVSLMHDRVIVLPLRQMWSDNSPNMVDTRFNRLFPQGLTALWRGIDQAVRFADTKIMRNFGLPIKQVFQKPKLQKESIAAIEQFEHRSKAKRDFTAQLQRNHLARFFNATKFSKQGTKQGNTKNDKKAKRTSQPKETTIPLLFRPDNLSLNSSNSNAQREEDEDEESRRSSEASKKDKNQTSCRKRLFKD